VALTLILGIYFLTGAIIGFVLQKTKILEKYKSFRKKK
jgi:predicted transporter